MPLHLNPAATSSRRQFLLRSAVGGIAVFTQRLLAAEAPASSQWALLSDCHIDANPATEARGVNMAENLKRVREEVLAGKAGLSGGFINGDCAYLKGLPADYQTLQTLVRPFADAGLPLSFNMGNHDDREPFYGAFAGQRAAAPLVDGKHVTVLETPLVNWFLIDSLFKTDVVTGKIGAAQLAWLTQALDARADKPAIVVGHHNFQETPTVKDGKESYSGIQDTIALRDALVARRQVKAYVFGHTHTWAVTQPPHLQGLHLVNLPPVAYVFNAARPNGWVRATVSAGAMDLELRALDAAHPEHAKVTTLTWRSDRA